VLFDSFVLACGFVYFYYKHSYFKSNLKSILKNLIFKEETAFLLLRDSWPLIVITISAMIYNRIDQIMIKEMISSEAVGLYSASYTIYSALVAFSPIFAYSFQTALINSHKYDIERFEKRMVALYAFAIWIILPISLLVSFYSQEIINIVFGLKYDEAKEALKLYIYCAVFAFIGGISSRWFIINNYQRFMTFYLIISAFLNIILNLYLIPIYGIWGASLASLISFSVASTFSNLISIKTYKNFELQFFAFAYPLVFIYNTFKNKLEKGGER